jgi:hypothetical protein
MAGRGGGGRHVHNKGRTEDLSVILSEYVLYFRENGSSGPFCMYILQGR